MVENRPPDCVLCVMNKREKGLLRFVQFLLSDLPIREAIPLPLGWNVVRWDVELPLYVNTKSRIKAFLTVSERIYGPASYWCAFLKSIFGSFCL